MKAQLPLLFTLCLCACEQRAAEPTPRPPEAAPAPSTPAAGALDLGAAEPQRPADPEAGQTRTSSASAQALSSEEERTDGCLYAEAELRGVRNPGLARSAVQNRARAHMKTRLKELKARLTPKEQAELQKWLERPETRVEVLSVRMTAEGWSARARLGLSGLRELAPALHTRLLAAGATSAAGTP